LDQADLLAHVVDALEQAGARYAVTGSQASIAYGEVRFTNDIDVLTDLTAGTVDTFVSRFPEDEYYVSVDAARQAVASGGQFNIIHPTSALKVDVIIARAEQDFRALSRSRSMRVTSSRERNALFIAPEDLILKKMEFYRAGGSDKHLRDIVGMLNVSSGSIDRSEIARDAGRLGLGDVWQRVLDAHGIAP
jgi:hypothetical protein